MPHRAIRFKANGQYLQNTMHEIRGADYLGSSAAMMIADDENGIAPMPSWLRDLAPDERAGLCVSQEQHAIESWKADYAIAFGLPADVIEAEPIAGWDGNPDTLPRAADSDPSGKHVRIPEEQREGYIAPEPVPPTPLEIIANAILADTGTSQAFKDAARAAIVAGGEVVSDKVVPMVPKGG